VVKCPDLAQSQAFLEAQGVRPGGEWEVVLEALNSNADLSSAAAGLMEERQAKLEEVLEQEAADGADVSIDCFTFSDWDQLSNYGTSAE
jgi:hypothetical protein